MNSAWADDIALSSSFVSDAAVTARKHLFRMRTPPIDGPIDAASIKITPSFFGGPDIHLPRHAAALTHRDRS